VRLLGFVWVILGRVGGFLPAGQGMRVVDACHGGRTRVGASRLGGCRDQLLSRADPQGGGEHLDVLLHVGPLAAARELPIQSWPQPLCHTGRAVEALTNRSLGAPGWPDDQVEAGGRIGRENAAQEQRGVVRATV
jgi:hypothetical protein